MIGITKQKDDHAIQRNFAWFQNNILSKYGNYKRNIISRILHRLPIGIIIPMEFVFIVEAFLKLARMLF